MRGDGTNINTLNEPHTQIPQIPVVATEHEITPTQPTQSKSLKFTKGGMGHRKSSPVRSEGAPRRVCLRWCHSPCVCGIAVSSWLFSVRHFLYISFTRIKFKFSFGIFWPKTAMMFLQYNIIRIRRNSKIEGRLHVSVVFDTMVEACEEATEDPSILRHFCCGSFVGSETGVSEIYFWHESLTEWTDMVWKTNLTMLRQEYSIKNKQFGQYKAEMFRNSWLLHR